MHRFLKNIVSSVKRHFGRPLPRPRDRRVCPRLEALENRTLLHTAAVGASRWLFL
jgi:hypothetical protein